ncbi:MAG: hypothetical protein MJ252_11710 [archaeon]|nr:hypothetical protein [archaeon]
MNKYCSDDFSKFTLKFKCDMNGDTYTISCHRVFRPEKINESITKVMAHKERKEGQKYSAKLAYNGLYELKYVENEYNMRDWVLGSYKSGDNPEIPVFTKYNPKNLTLVKFIEVSENTFIIGIAGVEKYLMIDTDNSRDDYSYYLNYTTDKEKASKFKMEKTSR